MAELTVNPHALQGHDPGGGHTRRGRTLRVLRLGLDASAITVAWALAFQLRFEGGIPVEMRQRLVVLLPWVLLTAVASLSVLVSSRRSWRHVTLGDAIRVGAAIGTTGLFLALARAVAPALVVQWSSVRHVVVPWGVLGIFLPLAFIGLVVVRVARRAQVEFVERRRTPRPGDRRRIVLVGAGRAGRTVLQEIVKRPDVGLDVVGFVDDDESKRGSLIANRAVLGTLDDLPRIAATRGVDTAVITITDASPGQIRRVVTACENADLATRIIPEVGALVDGTTTISSLRPVEIEDLLARDPVDLELDAIRDYVSHDVVMVTGAGGSIGSELCRQLLTFAPKRLLLVERSEPALWAIDRELQAIANDTATQVMPCVGDVTDADRMDHLVLTQRPSVIFHAAAHKHVPMCERNPGEAVKNNVLGTKTVVDVAARRGVERFVLVSTDKAVNPTSTMGATKRVAERYVQHVAVTTGRPYVAVRFGNVLGSTGSVVPIFREQIENGGPVTVTHPDMRRYFMTIPEASRLVLQAAVIGAPGEVLVLDMGEPVRIVQLAEDLIRLSGLTPHEDIQITFSGVRDGEKLFEELNLLEEGATRTRHPKVFIGRSSDPRWHSVDTDLGDLLAMRHSADADAVRTELARHVPEMTADHRDIAVLTGSAGPAT